MYIWNASNVQSLFFLQSNRNHHQTVSIADADTDDNGWDGRVLIVLSSKKEQEQNLFSK